MLTIILAMMLDIGTLKQQADLIEINTKHNEKGKVDFTQVILWEWSPDYRRYNVVKWWIVDSLDEMPKFRHGNWHCKNFQSKHLRRTKTLHDPEKQNRMLHPISGRLNVRSKIDRLRTD